MSLFRLARALPSLFATALALTVARPAAAQTPRIPPDARGFQATMMLQQYHQNRAARFPESPPARPAPSLLRESVPTAVVDVNVSDNPVSEPTTYVTIKGQDGVVRRFPLATGVRVEYTRGPVVLRPGESTTIRITPLP